jgi:glycosyltransferase involved in cell wall biosynthesis
MEISNIPSNPNQPEAMPEPPKRLLILADFACATGFAQVAHNIVAQLLKTKKYQIDVVGINYMGMPNEWHNLHPTVRLLPAQLIARGDLFGREGYLNLLANGTYDLTFILQDTFIIEPIGKHISEIRSNLKAQGKKVFKWIYYFPIDATPKENWLRESVARADYPVVYTEFGKREVLKLIPELSSKLRVIAHGTDPTTFKPVDEETKKIFKNKFFVEQADGKFLVTNVNRNQPRKDVARTMQIFRLFKDQAPEALLYLHMKENDVAYGLHEVARSFDLIPGKDYIVPKNFDEHNGVPLAIVNGIYNVSDVVMTTSLGEGWGLSMTEAMAVGTPVIAPNHTSLTEMLANGRGTLVPAGKSLTDWVMLQGDNERKRPLVSVADYVDQLMYIRNHYAEVKEKALEAQRYLLEHWTWDVVGAQWTALFEEALKPQEKLVVGRNDRCPLCIKEGNAEPPKWKRCKLHNEEAL